ncbi:FISUMP domain-containing protein [Zobellia galactanivorans]|uniref:FISUMP domain-containing protein n=1 Tax=Zobellia galactanivorans (strain DSM 12802 / CCUG 47099 / CIP 106680 / NCIMB 13871 / Dsij) TaxID=63186 RepID=UPI001C07E121|nr:FISUMP domain-containing protein [Zobellia galactanivorans]MBU3025528.1 hypothetical protein [Zobellia galactanivorans]
MKYIEKVLMVISFVSVITLLSCNNDDEETIELSDPRISLKSPGDKSDGIDIAPTFSWEATDPMQKSLKYDFYLGLDSTKLFSQASKLEATTYTLTDYKLRKDKVYYWQVFADNGSDRAASEIWSFSSIPAPDAPILDGPSDNIFVRDQLEFTWQEVVAGEGEELQYQVFFGKTNPPKEKVATTKELAYSMDPVDLEVGEVYYWQVKVSDLINDSASEVRMFKKLKPGAPDEPMAISPEHKSGQYSSTIALKWDEASDPENDAVSYTVYLDEVSPPNVKLGENISATQINAEGLEINKPYYWRIEASDPMGNTTESSVFSFTILNAGAPGAPIVQDLAVNGVFSLDESLIWAKADGAVSYDIYIDTVYPPLNKVAEGLTETEYKVPNSDIPSDITDVKTYYAIVVAKDADGNESSSVPLQFTPQMTGSIRDARGDEVNHYEWVRVGTQVWMSQNLRATRFTDGEKINQLGLNELVKDDVNALYYNEHPAVEGFPSNWVNTYGRVYSWWVVESAIAPEGWHVMKPSDINTLKAYAGHPRNLLSEWHEGGANIYGLNYETAGWRYPSSNDFVEGFRVPLEQSRANLWVNNGNYGVWELNASYNNTFRYFDYHSGMMFGIRLVKD